MHKKTQRDSEPPSGHTSDKKEQPGLQNNQEEIEDNYKQTQNYNKKMKNNPKVRLKIAKERNPLCNLRAWGFYLGRFEGL